MSRNVIKNNYCEKINLNMDDLCKKLYSILKKTFIVNSFSACLILPLVGRLGFKGRKVFLMGPISNYIKEGG